MVKIVSLNPNKRKAGAKTFDCVKHGKNNNPHTRVIYCRPSTWEKTT